MCAQRWFLSCRVAEFSIAGRDLHVAHALLALDVATPVELALAPEDEGGDDDGDVDGDGDDDDGDDDGDVDDGGMVCSE